MAEFSLANLPPRTYRGFPKTSVFGKATLKFAVLQDCRKIKSLKNRKSLSQNRAR
jgi:hypothetical protein